MPQSIYTIPITEAYEQTDICPICVLKNRHEAEVIDYLIGPAVMDSDVRTMTNRHGFCRKHLDMLHATGKRLPVALLLQTHLETMTAPREPDCYVCQQIQNRVTQVISNTIAHYKKDKSFRGICLSHSNYCLPHAKNLLTIGQEKLGKLYPEFADGLMTTVNGKNQKLLADLQTFTASFDYRNQGKPLPEDARASSRAVTDHLTGYAE